MKTIDINHARVAKMLAIATAISFAVAGCVTTPPQAPQGSTEARSKLSNLQSDSMLAAKAPVEIRDAEAAVLLAEEPVGEDDVALGNHRVYMADRKVEIARAKATTRYAVDQRAVLSQERDKMRLDARTREADTARRQAALAQSQAEAERAQASTEAAKAATAAATAATAAAMAASESAAAEKEADNLQRQIEMLKAEATERGLVLTLGGVLFGTGRAELTSGGNAALDKLVTFLDEYKDRNVAIEGHTDDVGSLEMNQVLSQNRAESVKAYLIGKGIQPMRIIASGMGETQPIADNGSSTGRQLNRRVEVIIKNPSAAIPPISIN